MKVALVHDFLTRLGGAERVLASFRELFPKAPVYTLLYDEKKTGAVFPSENIRTSRLQHLPSIIKKNHKYMLPWMPQAVEEWDFSDFDLVLSSSSAFTHGILTSDHTRHICYMHSPMRYAWDWTHEYVKEQKIGFLKRAAVAAVLKKLRMWDQTVVDRADMFIANSHNVRRRIQKYYRRDSTVIYPPVDISRFKIGKEKDATPWRGSNEVAEPKLGLSEDYFLIISTLTPYKRIDLAIQLFNKIRRRLVIIGDGPQKEFLQNISGSTIDFLGFKDDALTAEYLKNCRALIFPGEEDFGITPVEAMACGKPVLAYGIGGVTESVIPGVTGEFFMEPTVESMEDGLARLMKNENAYSPQKCRTQAQKFSKEVFFHNLKGALSSG